MSPLLGSTPLTRPLQLSGINSSAGYAKFYSSELYIDTETFLIYHIVIVSMKKHFSNYVSIEENKHSVK